MNRKEIINKLINEGFSLKTLSIMSDKNISELSKRFLKESDVMISKKDPKFKEKIIDAKKTNKTIETYENKEVIVKKKKAKEQDVLPIDEKDKIDSKLFKKKQKRKIDKDLKEWVNNVVGKNVKAVTTKSEILEMISKRM